MGKILVTGASGDIGRKTLLHLLKLKPANQLIGLARDPSKAADLAAKGIEIRQGDYYDRDSLSRAFQGVEKLMLTSTHAFTDRKTAHGNVIDVAAENRLRGGVGASAAGRMVRFSTQSLPTGGIRITRTGTWEAGEH